MFSKRAVKIVTLILGIGLIVLIGGFLALQLVPVDTSNPPVVSEPNWDSPQTQTLVEQACYDCHSNETKWPWYSHVAPVSWIISREVHEGRRSLNYSEWSAYQENESIETILQGRMPPQQYSLFHPEARLSNAEKQTLIAGLKKTFGSSVESERESGREEGRQGEEDSEREGN